MKDTNIMSKLEAKCRDWIIREYHLHASILHRIWFTYEFKSCEDRINRRRSITKRRSSRASSTPGDMDTAGKCLYEIPTSATLIISLWEPPGLLLFCTMSFASVSQPLFHCSRLARDTDSWSGIQVSVRLEEWRLASFTILGHFEDDTVSVKHDTVDSMTT